MSWIPLLAMALTFGASGHAPGDAADRAQPLAPPAAEASLWVMVFCEPYGMCEAYSSGGSGGNTWSWTNASMTYGVGDMSFAYPECYGSRVIVTVTVMDSSGQTAQDSTSACA